MSLLKHLTEDDVISDFATNINDFSEQYHLLTEKPRPMICKIMIEKFHGKTGKSDDWMRKRIDPKYKMAYRISNVKQKKVSKIDKLRKKLRIAESELLEATHEVSVKAKQDF